MVAPVYTQNASGRHVYRPEARKLYRIRSVDDYDTELLPAGHLAHGLLHPGGAGCAAHAGNVVSVSYTHLSLRPLLAARAVHLPLSVALFWLGSTVPVQAVQTFTTLTERVVVLRRVPLDLSLIHI